jgi:hypothetical protein
MTSSTPVPDDIPDLADPGVKVVRHSFGAGSALFIVLGLFTLGALVTYKLSMDDMAAREFEKSVAPALLASDEPVVKETVKDNATPPEDFALELAPQQTAAVDQSKLHEAIDGAFRKLDQQDADELKLFIARFASDPYAVEKGYVELAGKAYDSLIQQEEDEESRRQKEQQAVPWDMGVEPPKGKD